MAIEADGARTHDILTEERLRWISRHTKSFIIDQSEKEVSSDESSLDSLFRSILHTAASPLISAPHRVAAWNALCALIDESSTSPSSAVGELIWNRGVWESTFDLYIVRSGLARPKSSKQLLSTLSSALRRSVDNRVEIDNATKRIIQEISNEANTRRAKASLQVLAHFLSKEVLSLDRVLRCWKQFRSGNAEQRRHDDLQGLLYALLAWTGRGDFGSVVGHVISVTLDKASLHGSNSTTKQANSKARPIWLRSVEDVLKDQTVGIDDMRIHIFPSLFQRDILGYIELLNRHGQLHLPQDDNERLGGLRDVSQPNEDLFHAALQVGKELGMLYEIEDAELSHTASTVYLPVGSIKHLLVQSSRRSRITGLSLLITSHSVTRPFPPSTLTLIKRHLHAFLADGDANFRGEVFTLMQRLMDRLRAITAALARQSHPGAVANGVDQAIEADLSRHEAFLKWFISFLIGELRPTATYQRHISALKTLLIVTRSGCISGVPNEALSKSALMETKWPFSMQIVTEKSRPLLLELLLNPFDDVRQTAVSILACHSSSYDSTQRVDVCKQLQQTIERAEKLMLQTGRADQADGVAHLYLLLYQHMSNSLLASTRQNSSTQGLLMNLLESLERMLDIARKSLQDAVNKYPLHGLMTSLRYILLQDTCDSIDVDFRTRLIACAHAVWRIVKPVLCNDAPEGYLPEDFEDTLEISTKSALSYCWRALKESSLLLGALLSRDLLREPDVLSIGELCFSQLAELRHRGAFSTTAQTWITCCIKVSTLREKAGEAILQKWYDDVFLIINNRTTINTRRSAGVPALLCGLLIADKTGHLLGQAFKDLGAVATQPVDAIESDGSSLPQVHALNCIKDLLKTTRLGGVSERYVPASLRIATQSLRSRAWAIRNCGLMLFRAVIDRLLGTSAAHLEEDSVVLRQLSIDQYPELLGIILELLMRSKEESEMGFTENKEGVFPALQLLQHMDLSARTKATVSKEVLTLAGSASWHIRDKAARTYATLFSVEEILHEIGERILATPTGQNARHGILLCVKYLIRRLTAFGLASQFTTPCSVPRNSGEIKASSMTKWITALLSRSPTSGGPYCVITEAAHVDNITETLQLLRKNPTLAEQCQISEGLLNQNILLQQRLKQSLEPQKFCAEHHVLRMALVRALACELHIETGFEDQTVISSLAARDPDTCCAFFRAYSHFNQDVDTMSSLVERAVLDQACEILKGDYDVKLKIDVQRFILNLADKIQRSGTTAMLAESLSGLASNASFPLARNSSPEYGDQWIQVQSLALEHRCRLTSQVDEELRAMLTEWMQNCCTAINGQGLFSREAVAFAISRLHSMWQPLHAIDQPLFCGLCFGLYDLLNDDDEDVRLRSSRAASRITRVTAALDEGKILDPPYVSEALARWMVKSFSEDSIFVQQAFLRGFGISESTSYTLTEQLAASEITTFALFAEEKQNLYIDEAREVRLWSRILLTVDPKSVAQSLMSSLSIWVEESLDVLTLKATSKNDGALGWSLNPEVFTLGLCVIYGVEYLLHAAEHGVRLLTRPSTIRLKLAKLGEAATASRVNILWIREIERVMEQAVRRTLQRSGAVTRGLYPM